MERKDFLRLISITTGASLIGGEYIFQSCNNPASVNINLSKNDIAFLNEVAETILPKTSSPGAKEAKVGEFMQIIVRDCYKANEQKVFKKGIDDLNTFCQKQTNKNFMNISPQEREKILIQLDKIALTFQKEKDKKEYKKKQEANINRHLEYNFEPDHYYTMFKQLTLLGYFTSKQGMTQALRYKPVPGKWIGITDYKKGDKDWARY